MNAVDVEAAVEATAIVEGEEEIVPRTEGEGGIALRMEGTEMGERDG